MGIFSEINRSKEELGETAQKRGFFKFFEIFFRKIRYFMLANLVYTLYLIPTFVIIYIVSFAITMPITEESAALNNFSAVLLANLYISVFGAGPATSGMTYIMRNFAREENAWVWSDFFAAVKGNFKQSLVVFVTDIIMVVLFTGAVFAYSNLTGYAAIIRYILYFGITIFTIMHMYIYPIMVTFDLKLIDIYKNSFIFAILKLPSNLAILAVLAFLHIGLPLFAISGGGANMLYFSAILILAEAVVTQAFSAFLVNFGVYPRLKKYMLDATIQKKGEINDAGENS